MARNFDLIVFDWDGTVHDSIQAIVSALQATCRDLDLPEPVDSHVRQVIGLALKDALRHSAPQISEEKMIMMAERYRYNYFAIDHDLLPFAGIPELLAELKESGFMLAIATGKSRRGLDRVLKSSGLGRFFVASRCADECFSKPNPQMLYELMDELAIAPERTLMIGDTIHDVQMAINANVAALAVTYGAHTKEALGSLQPLALMHGVDDLTRWLRESA